MADSRSPRKICRIRSTPTEDLLTRLGSRLSSAYAMLFVVIELLKRWSACVCQEKDAGVVSWDACGRSGGRNNARL